jgi:hypothetical protein
VRSGLPCGGRCNGPFRIALRQKVDQIRNQRVSFRGAMLIPSIDHRHDALILATDVVAGAVVGAFDWVHAAFPGITAGGSGNPCQWVGVRHSSSVASSSPQEYNR